MKTLYGICLANSLRTHCARGHLLPPKDKDGKRICRKCKNALRQAQRKRVLPAHPYAGSSHCKACLATYDSDRWIMRMRRQFRPHQYVNAHHCRPCAREYDKIRYRMVRAAVFEPHEFVDSRHCKDCNNRQSQLVKQRRREKIRLGEALLGIQATA